MITTLTGENSFGLQQALRQLIDAFVAEQGDLALERLDGQEADLARISEALNSLPFLANKKLVVLRAPSSNKQFTEQAEQLLDTTTLPETTDVIIVEPKLDKRLSYYKFLKNQTDFRDFPELDQQGLARYLVETTKQKDGSISPADARYLVERVGANQQMLSNELEKLLLNEPNVSRRTIELLTTATPQSTIFQLLEAVFAGHTKRALALYQEQRALKVEPPQIIALLAWQLHVLAILKTANMPTTTANTNNTSSQNIPKTSASTAATPTPTSIDRITVTPQTSDNTVNDHPKSLDQIAREAKLNPYVLGKSQSIARQLTLARLKTLIADLLAIDLKTKRTPIDPDEALQHYLLKLAES